MMLKRLQRQVWTCPQCTRVSRLSSTRRGLATATAAAPVEGFRPVSNSDPSANHDDRTLRQIFDSQPFWREFSARTSQLNGGESAGLFRNRYLTRPEGFQQFASTTLVKCKRIVAKVLAYSSVEEYKRIPRDLDRLSDLLCRVIDLAEFVRSTHPDPKMQNAATQAYMLMFQYMNVLNTTPGLDSRLKEAISNPEVSSTWTEEERTVADILARDFAKSAIELPEAEREAFVNISNEISETGSTFVDEMCTETPSITLASSRLKGMDPMVVRQLTRHGNVSLPTMGMPANLALRTVDDAETRREIYMANRTSSKANIRRLEGLLSRRAELAKLSGHDSFAHMALSDKMAKTPEAVNQFLGALAKENAPQAQNELSELLEIKKSDARSDNFPNKLNAWDRDYYTARMLSSIRSRARTPDFLSAYFSIGTVMQGLSRLFSRLYGIRLVPRETLPGETWNNDVRRLDVIDSQEGHIAVIYCDLFQRAGKSPNPAHFTVRCSRRIDEDELQEAAELSSSDSMFSTVEDAANDGLATNKSLRDGGKVYQLPTIALICDFAFQRQSRSDASRPALLTFREVQTLFHEMGHALHSICGRTVLQNVSGTRCATDFAELPSVLMEHFASAPEVLALYARHWETDTPLDPVRVSERLEIDRRMHGAEVESQILMSMLDQRYHSANVLNAGSSFDSTKIYHDIWNQYSLVPEPAGTSWQGFFGHLFGYGATYYAYLFDRAIAGKIWKDVFQRKHDGAIDEEAGQLFRREVLQWGGGRDGWKCIAGAVGDKEGVLAEGREGAMEMVGKWGLKN